MSSEDRENRIEDGFRTRVETKVYKRRWYVLLLFSLLACHQCTIWNTFGPVELSIKYAYSWSNTTIAMMVNWGAIMFLAFVLPTIWFFETYGLRPTTLICTGMTAVGSILRVVSTKDTIFLIMSHTCAILNGITGCIVMAAPVALSAAWFPPDERTTATTFSVMMNGLGNGVSYLVGPLLVPDDFLNSSCETPTVLTNYSYEVPTPEEVRQQIWLYMVLDAALATAIFIGMIIYFPSKPKVVFNIFNATDVYIRPEM